MQTDKNDMKVEKSVSLHSHTFERSCKRQIVTDPKSRNASHIQFSENHLNFCKFSLQVPSWSSFLRQKYKEKDSLKEADARDVREFISKIEISRFP